MRSDAALNGPHGTASQHQFRALPRDQQIQAIRRLAIVGHADESIAIATGLTAQQVRVVLQEEEGTMMSTRRSS